jgi:Arc/MetJ-type ribon-helix-helix transcriptional regulator
MPTVSVRISEKEKKKLVQYGSLSNTIREALRLYLDSKKSRQLLRKLEELQRKNPVKTTKLQEVRLIKEDRNR